MEITNHLALGNVTVVDFYADWCGACKWLSPHLEQIARSDPEIALRKIDIVNWKTAVARQYHIGSIPQVKFTIAQADLSAPLSVPTSETLSVT